jgi:sarcosine oxidase subunit beta
MKQSAEVVIIGGGCMGASVAYNLARRGVTDLVLIEKEPMLGMGSTGRNAGGVRHQFSTEANIKLSIESISLLEHFEDEVGYEVDFHQDGYLFLLSDKNSVAIFQQSVDTQKRLGVDVAWFGPGEAAALAPGLSVEGVRAATFCATDGIADPNGVTVGFARAAQTAGAVIERETEVLGIDVDGGRVTRVRTDKGNISTRTVVNAAGPWAQRVGRMVGIEIPVLPYRRHIFITDALPATRGAPSSSGIPAAAVAAVPSNRIMVIDFETTFYFHREGAGILFGMSDPDEPSGYDTSVRWDFLDRVTQVAVRRLPALGEAAIAHAWAGLYEMTPDAMPIIGPAPDVEGFFMINGFSGHGFQHSPAAGRILAEMIVDGRAREVDAAAFSIARFSIDRCAGELNVV